MTDLAARIDWGLIPAVPVPFRGTAIAADAQRDYARWLARQGVAGVAVWAHTGRGPHLTPALRVVSDFVHNGQASDVRSVMVDGRWLMRDHRVVTLDEPAIVAEADRIARAAWGRLFAERPDLTRPPGLDLAPRGGG